MRACRLRLAVFACAIALACSAFPRVHAAETETAEARLRRARDLQLQLQQFRNMGTVLMIAAHPDDENTQLITYFARGRGYRMGYLSVTRGDGGQNLLGPEFGEVLGTIRTHELLAAREIDSGVQFFTRAIDFGYSKDFKESLATWNREQVLGDVVRVIRTFRPDVIVTRFPPIFVQGQHGQHIGSAVLGVEAFKLAGDPKAHPEQLGTLQPWQPKRIMLNGGGGGGRGGPPAPNPIRIDVAGIDSVTGESFGVIANRSRAMHKSQGFGNIGQGGGGGGPTGPQMQSFVLLDGEAATADPMDGVNVTWARIPGGEEIGKLADELLTKFNADAPSQNVPALLTIREKILALPEATRKQPLVAEKLEKLDRIIVGCLGLQVRSIATRAEYAPGEVIELRHQAALSGKASVPVAWLSSGIATATGGSESEVVELTGGETAPLTRREMMSLSPDLSITQPYWLQADHEPGTFTVQNANLIATPANGPAVAVRHSFKIGGQSVSYLSEPLAEATGADGKPTMRRVDIVPAVSLRFPSEVRIFAPGATKSVSVEITARKAGTAGQLSLTLPTGWKATPAALPFKLDATNAPQVLTFTVTAPQQVGTADIGASARVDGYGVPFVSQRIDVKYDHLPWLMFNPPARTKGVVVALETRGKNIGYIAGAGDSVAECIEQMGYNVTQITGADLTAEKLKAFDAVVVGVRAFNVRDDLLANLPALFTWVENGGTAILQYNRQDRIQNAKLSPFASLKVSGERITDETAKPIYLVPDHAALTTPNRITDADFEGWVQERGIYFPNEWSPELVPVLAFSDPGERALNGGLLVAKHGKGHFVYTGLVWFRQLPAGVPGAYRLFANLLSLGK